MVDTMTLYYRAQAALKRGDPFMVFDWVALLN
jgi:hypothetical protein